MRVDDSSEHSERGRGVRTWPALLVGGTSIPFDLIQAALVDFDVTAIDEPTHDSLRAFFSTPAVRDAAARALQAEFPECSLECVDLADDDWAARSQANLHAIQVGGIVVAPPWDVPAGPDLWPRREPAVEAGGAPIVIIIQPSMGFGTGHHATTRLCLDALQDVDLRGRRVIDVGTGSGVLALAASRLGATSVLGLDDDADAIQAARESAALNAGAEVGLAVVDFRVAVLDPADVVLANLTGGLLAGAASRLLTLTAPNGRLILSGFMQHEEDDVLRGFKDHSVERRRQEDEWLCVTLVRTGASE